MVKTIGRDRLRIRNKSCQLVSEQGDDALDLAVLSVLGLPDVKPLILSDQGRQDLVFSIYGYGPEGRRLKGTLGQRTPKPHSKGDDLAYWDYYLDEQAAYFERIKDGCSGSPVYDPNGGHVVAVVTHRVGEDKGSAVDVCELVRVYTAAEGLFQTTTPHPSSDTPRQTDPPVCSKSARHLPDKFLLAFSFAGEHRDLVRAVARVVESDLATGPSSWMSGLSTTLQVWTRT